MKNLFLTILTTTTIAQSPNFTHFAKDPQECYPQGVTNPQIMNYRSVTNNIVSVESKGFYCIDKPTCRVKNNLVLYLFAPESSTYPVNDYTGNRYCNNETMWSQRAYQCGINKCQQLNCKAPRDFFTQLLMANVYYSTDKTNWKMIVNNTQNNYVYKGIQTYFDATKKGYLKVIWYVAPNTTIESYTNNQVNWQQSNYITQETGAWLNLTTHDKCTLKP